MSKLKSAREGPLKATTCMHELSCCTQNVYVAKSGDHVGIRLLGYNFPRVSGITAKRNTPFKMDKLCRDIATGGRYIYIRLRPLITDQGTTSHNY